MSRGYAGSKHDIAILRTHADLINNTPQGRSILGDLGYRGAEHDIPSFIVCGESDPLRSRRVIVECFFGRLKSLWTVFARAWTLEKDDFDVFFDVACGLTNVHVLLYPLQQADLLFNKGVLNMIKARVLREKDAQRQSNEAYRRRRLERLEYETMEIDRLL